MFLCPQIVFPAASDGKELNIFTQLLHVCAIETWTFYFIWQLELQLLILRLDKRNPPQSLKYAFTTAELQTAIYRTNVCRVHLLFSDIATPTSLPYFSALREGVQQDAQPDGPHASPLRQQTLQMPLLPEQVHSEGEPHQTHEGQARCDGQGAGWKT